MNGPAAPAAAAAPYLPHEADAVLLEGIRAVDAHTTLATAVVRTPSPFSAVDGSWPSWLVIELMAQAVAAGVGLREFQPGVRPRLGLLLGVRDFSCAVDRFADGTTLAFEVTESTRDDRGMGVFDCALDVAGSRAAHATLSVYLPPDVDEYLRSVEA
jgi:predicted hotdog family 3-hydroxylacyl-ACP dehydratase